MSFTFKTGRTAVRLTAAAITATALLGLTTTASAWTVSGAPVAVVLNGTQVSYSTYTNQRNRAEFICNSSSFSGSALTGTGLAGSAIASQSGITGGGCSAPLGIPATMTTSGAFFDAVSYDAASQTTSGFLRNLTVTLKGSPPTVVTANGDVAATYSNATNRFKILPAGSTLTAIAPTSIYGMVTVGDVVAIAAEFDVTPTAFAITNP